MERLTKQVENGCLVLCENCIRDDKHCKTSCYEAVFDRLAAYEDTGLEPDEIARLVDANKSSTWVSVKDRPPTKDIYSHEYNVVIKGAKRSTTLYFDGTWYDGDRKKYDVTHWMPMPEVPEGGMNNMSDILH